MKKVWPIKDLDCAACAAKLEDALSRVKGVESVSVNYLNATLTLVADDAAFDQVTDAVLAKAAKVEPDATIVVDSAAQHGDAHTHHHNHHHEDDCYCHGDHEHHHDHHHEDDCCCHGDHEHHHDHHHEDNCCHGDHEHHHDHHHEGDCCCHGDHEHHHDHDHAHCSCGHDHHHEEAPIDTTSPVAKGCVRKVYPIEGLDCANCAAKLEDALSKIDGIENVRVSFVHQNVVLVAAEEKLSAITRAMTATCQRVEPDATIHFDATVSAQKGAEKKREMPILLLRLLGTLIFTAVALLLPQSCFAAKLVLFLCAYLSASYDVLWKALKNISRGQIFDENFLMTVASIGAVLMGEYPEAIAVMTLYQIGEWFQGRAVEKSRASIASLMDIRPDYANLLVDGEIRTVNPESVNVGDLIVIRPGEKVPMDGTVVEGTSSLNTVALTGESLPRDVRLGDSVISGCVNLSGVLTVRVDSVFGESTVAKILNLVESSGDSKAQTERFITKFARYYTPAVCGAALLLAIVPSLFTGEWSKWVMQALSFLVISCPCALVISVPLSFFSGIGGASRKGILIKGANYLETLSQLDTVAFDKTGTLTKGVFSVSAIHPEGCAESDLLDMAAHAECYSTHPIAVSLREAYGKALDNARVSDVEEIAGHGLKAIIDGRQIYVGNSKLMDTVGLVVKPCSTQGTIVHVACDGQYRGHIVISDMLKPTTKQAMDELKSSGVNHLVMLTGDRKDVAEDIAASVGLTEVKAELLPADKVTALAALLGDGHKVGFVGDGINDAPVLRRADLGIAMGAMGSDAAIEAADVVLMDDDPIKLPLAIRIARRTMSIVHQNIVFALGVKALIMVLGFLGIANMWLAVFADVGVAMLAILNAMRAMRCK